MLTTGAAAKMVLRLSHEVLGKLSIREKGKELCVALLDRVGATLSTLE